MQAGTGADDGAGQAQDRNAAEVKQDGVAGEAGVHTHDAASEAGCQAPAWPDPARHCLCNKAGGQSGPGDEQHSIMPDIARGAAYCGYCVSRAGALIAARRNLLSAAVIDAVLLATIKSLLGSEAHCCSAR